MENLSEKLDASKSESSLLVLFIPSVDREEKPFDQSEWITAALKLLGFLFGGATHFRKARAGAMTPGAESWCSTNQP